MTIIRNDQTQQVIAEFEQRMSELRAILPDSSDEELRQMLGEDDLIKRIEVDTAEEEDDQGNRPVLPSEQLAANDVLGSDPLERFTLRTLIEKGMKGEDSSNGDTVTIESVRVDQTDAFDLLDLPLSCWLRPADTPKIEVSATHINTTVHGSMRMDGRTPLHQICEE